MRPPPLMRPSPTAEPPWRPTEQAVAELDEAIRNILAPPIEEPELTELRVVIRNLLDLPEQQPADLPPMQRILSGPHSACPTLGFRTRNNKNQDNQLLPGLRGPNLHTTDLRRSCPTSQAAPGMGSGLQTSTTRATSVRLTFSLDWETAPDGWAPAEASSKTAGTSRHHY